jgi:hypothetical protein
VPVSFTRTLTRQQLGIPHWLIYGTSLVALLFLSYRLYMELKKK